MLTKHKKHVKMLSTLYILNTSPPKGTQSSSSLHNVQHKTDRLFELFARLLFHLGFFLSEKEKYVLHKCYSNRKNKHSIVKTLRML